MTRRLLLLGGGHAHLAVLQALARAPVPDADVVLVSPHAGLVYSGMLPGMVAGHYTAAASTIPLAPLVAAAGARFVLAAATGIDPATQRVPFDDGTTLPFDVLSIDTGAVQQRSALPDADDRALWVRPAEHFAAQQQRLFERAGPQPQHIAVIGGGAAGFELVLALRHRGAAAAAAVRLTMVTGGPPPLASYARAVQQRALHELARHGVAVVRERAAALRDGMLVLDSGAALRCDAALMATGVDAPAWLQHSGLALCARGFVRTRPTLQTVSHDAIFAAGDVASRDGAALPRSGVYAVRAGPALAANLLRALAGQAPQPWQPPRRTLNLLSCGERRAIAVWGGFSATGRWAWWWKDRIDRRFVARNTPPLR